MIAITIAVPIRTSVGGMRFPISSAIGRRDWIEKPKSPWTADTSQRT